MFATHMEAAVGGTRSLARLDELAGDVWKAWGSGLISDDEAGRLSGAIEDRRRDVRPQDTVAVRAPCVARLAASCFPARRKRPSCPDKAASMARRRRLAASGPMPPALACLFTTGELAALRIVADEARARRACELTIGEIAARAGVGETTARNAIRAAAAAGLLLVVERRQNRAPNLPNVVRIVSREWLAWLAKRPSVQSGHMPATHRLRFEGMSSQGGGFGKAESTDTGFLSPARFEPGPGSARGLSRDEGGRSGATPMR